VLTVKAVNAEGADKTKLAATFDKRDSERLAKLTGMTTELESTVAQK
jgi:hypothetical protein